MWDGEEACDDANDVDSDGCTDCVVDECPTEVLAGAPSALVGDAALTEHVHRTVARARDGGSSDRPWRDGRDVDVESEPEVALDVVALVTSCA